MLASEMIDRTLAEWIYPGGDESPTFDFLTEAIDDTTLTIPLEGRIEIVPRDSVLQIGSELILTREVSGSAVTAAERGYRGSTPAEHSSDTLVEVDPPFTRLEIFHAIRELIGRMPAWGLYVREVDSSMTSDFNQVMEMPEGTREVSSILIRHTSDTYENWNSLRRKGFDWIEYKEFDPIKIRLLRGGPADQPMRIVLKKDFTLPTTEASDLTAGGVSEFLQEAMPMAVAGTVLKGREVPRATIDRIREALAAEGQVAGAILNVGESLISTFRRDAVMAERRRLDELDEPTFEWQRG